jgi:hypothetical protein
MSVVFSWLSTLRTAQSPTQGLLRRELVLRLALIAGLIVVMGLAAALAIPSAYSTAETELVRLLRRMALVKAGIAVVAVALVLWRLGQPVSPAAAFGYLLGVWALGGASVLIWHLSFIPAAALIFYAGVFGLLVLAWREGHFEARKRGV